MEKASAKERESAFVFSRVVSRKGGKGRAAMQDDYLLP